MRSLSIECDRCSTSGPPDGHWWTLTFNRENIEDGVVTVEQEVWDLCADCYEVVAPEMAAAIDELKETVDP